MHYRGNRAQRNDSSHYHHEERYIPLRCKSYRADRDDYNMSSKLWSWF